MTTSPTWTRFQGALTSCVEKLVEIYRQTMREDHGDYDWSILIKSAALGQVNEEISPQALLERVRKGIHGQDEAVLEYDTSWLGQEIEGLWVFARLYLVGSPAPAALVHRIDFEEEYADSLLHEDFEAVNDERSLDEE
jgi:hypothetical protein